MNAYIGIEVGAVICCVAAAEDKGMIGRTVFDLPLDEEQRKEALMSAIHSALKFLESKRFSCSGVGISASPPCKSTFDIFPANSSCPPDLPVVGGASVLFRSYEVEAMLPHFGGGQGKAWITMSNRSRIYFEGADYGTPLDVTGIHGADRKISYEICDTLLDPIRVLRNRIGLFETVEEIESMAALVDDSAGVRFSSRDEGSAILGIAKGIRRPQIARAALEAVACGVRYAIADLGGEGAVAELYVAGPSARNVNMMKLVADITGTTVVTSEIRDAIAFGAAMQAASEDGVKIERPKRTRYAPTMPAARREELYARWLISSSAPSLR
ncbi:MAG: hypothetical protein JKX97_01165 [Candidatus Lindowbacteria bacterium]|nr:hypothetical protein [Candidatus Lindowbacteria bacterium]